ncbi:long-chain fatty acid--CoA ligase [Alkalispirochaeta odontotermitis]|nr:long-chain fatty acid--CoA ligase [Alkalispirochaeta odontotermitis]CAB1078851.1 Long-chain-fatty-acid--CoA ligase (EC [Olavius algarvensis Delta 1 endosymbiont]
MDITKSIYDNFAAVAERRGDHTAVFFLGTRYSYNEIRSSADSFAAALTDMGVTAGHKVMLYIPNSIHWVVTWLGIQKIGAVGVPITPIYTPHDLAYIAEDSQAETIICADTNFGYVTSVLATTGLKRVVVSNVADLLPWWKRYFGLLFDIIPRGKYLLDARTFSLRKLLAQHRNPSSQSTGNGAGGRAPAEILYTGGTTKFPKGVPFTHDLFLVSADEQIRMSEPLIPVEDNVIMGNAPLFHILGQTCSLATLLTGGSLILQPRINIDATFDSIQRAEAKTMIGVPALYRMILEHVRLEQYDLSSLKYCFSGGDVLPIEVSKRWQEKFGIPIYQGYGATETCGGVSMCAATVDNPPRSVGRIVASKKVKLVDPASLDPVATGNPGELLVSSEHMVTSYLNKPEETAESFVELEGDTYYRTADIMSMDEDGNLFFVDRTVDTIKHKGYRVSASEIESTLQEHPAVIASCAVGIPDEKVGERIKAYVVLKEDIKGITGYDLIKWCRKTLVSYKVPHYIEFRDMLPKSKVGKLLRREIRSEEKRRSET